MADHPNVEMARSSLEAMMKGDLESMAAGIADDATWHVPGSNQWSGDYRGKPEIVGRFARMAEQGYRVSLDEIHDILGNDEHVMAMVRISATGPSGSASTDSVWVMHVRDGKATEFWGHNDDQGALDRVMA
ncbi:MAG: nuclear transport factor 2 family protein [Actinomycetota bacterium]|nr:nuclear transport factor 2 family protein [Actinomycetota bacterium]MDH5225142.1 nuclear transport factor 2 family protein [Actinomycetota bacterium]MDH5312249.1 nuclear transport factor 2 family protein [Actinomycetota bacterium]